MRRTLSWLLLSLLGLLMVLPFATGTAEAAGGKVYVLHIDRGQMIDPGLANITQRAFEEAAADPAAVAVAIVLDTPGGYTNAALQMKETILSHKIKSVAFVMPNMAASSGALVATSAEKLYMAPGSVIGAAEVRDAVTNQTADYKVMATWAGAFESAAQARGRDAALARAMVDRKTPVPGQKGELLVLTYEEAVAKRYADGVAADLDDALKQAGITNYTKVDVVPTMSDQVGRFLTQPWVAILLLVVGVIAIGIEFMKPGVTLPGLVGVVSLSLFFLGNALVGTAGMLEIGLALLGVLLLLIEAFVPGFGVFGAGGIIAMGASIFLAVPTAEDAFRYLAWTSVALAVALVGIVRALSKRGLGGALTLKRQEKGWVPARADLGHLIGRQGKSLTVLRPAGTAQFADEKVDVVTEGEFVQAGTQVKVIRVDGARVIVRPVQ